MKKVLLAVSVFALPLVTRAQGSGGDVSNIERLAEDVGGIIDVLIPIVFALALLYFFWGLAKFILSSGEDKEAGKNIMIWGIVALFVMASVWGIVNFIQETVGVNDNANAPRVSIPQ